MLEAFDALLILSRVQKYCYLQFFKMCVDFPGDASGTRLFGNNLCQSWQITRGPPNPNGGFIGKNPQ